MLIIVMEEKLMPVYNGNSIEEAIGNGLNDLQLSYDNVTINILSDVLENNLGEVIRQAEDEVKKKESKRTRYAKYGVAFGSGILANRLLSNKIPRSNRWGVLGFLTLFILLLFGLVIGMDAESTPQIQVPGSSRQFESVNFSIVAQQFEDAGFSNITLTPIEDLKFGIITKDGEVEKVTVSGNEEYVIEKWYRQDVPINIYYHTFEPEK